MKARATTPEQSLLQFKAGDLVTPRSPRPSVSGMILDSRWRKSSDHHMQRNVADEEWEMVKDATEFLGILVDVCRSSRASEPELKRVAEAGIFVDGKLKSFEGSYLRANLNVDEFEELLNRLGRSTVLGKNDSSRALYNHRWDSSAGGCTIWAASYC